MYNILVTGVGAIIGYGIIQSLRSSNFKVNIIGTDIYNDAVGKEWCDAFVPGVMASHEEYPNFLIKTIKEYNINLVIPGIEQDINRIVKEFDKFKHLDVEFALNNIELIQIANDKWNTHLQLVENKIPVIKTYIDGDFYEIENQLKTPMLLKPRRSYASKGIHQIENRIDYDYWKLKMKDNFMVQQIVGNTNSEYTVGVFGLGDGQSAQKLSLQRVLGSDGATSKAKVVDIVELNQIVDQLVSIFKPIGPTNFQFRKHQGEFLLLEINPRISSSTSIRNSFGFNEAEMCIEYYLRGEVPLLREIKKGSAVRYVKDLIIYDSNNI
ncbi:ATP-grasp domain-containing protein [Lysinibacillus capsici]|uniref:ATP-grasp domain-containing protein n=1 Tax=Lysinibacillus TaxID=400634 RepID=UPI00214AE538|nr:MULTISPECIES: ATP-grasp domain-containing protein [Lysinibacillus]UUV25146.1 ATP-grasp domain-containing protein [Lysinibacillus sp. FN11]UYB48018.1 ATP-grasp domain-containing protein [Lysinibacillus capsici]